MHKGDHNYIELPSMEVIEEMDRQRKKAIDSLEIAADGHHVRCQGCHKLQAIPGLNKDNNNNNNCWLGETAAASIKIQKLQNRIKTSERFHPDGSTCINEKEELRQILEEEKQRDMLRRLPLYSCSTTGYKFVCGKCYDEVYMKNRMKSKEAILTKTIFQKKG